MSTRVYTIQRFDPPTARSRCFQVRLKIEGDTFHLSVSEHYNDWGDRAQNGTTYRGSVIETGREIRCMASRKRVVDIFYDHDGRGAYVRNERQTMPDNSVFLFPKTANGDLTCTLRFDAFQGEVMSTAVKPVKDQFPSKW